MNGLSFSRNSISISGGFLDPLLLLLLPDNQGYLLAEFPIDNFRTVEVFDIYGDFTCYLIIVSIDKSYHGASTFVGSDAYAHFVKNSSRNFLISDSNL